MFMDRRGAGRCCRRRPLSLAVASAAAWRAASGRTVDGVLGEVVASVAAEVVVAGAADALWAVTAVDSAGWVVVGGRVLQQDAS